MDIELELGWRAGLAGTHVAQLPARTIDADAFQLFRRRLGGRRTHTRPDHQTERENGQQQTQPAKRSFHNSPVTH